MDRVYTISHKVTSVFHSRCFCSIQAGKNLDFLFSTVNNTFKGKSSRSQFHQSMDNCVDTGMDLEKTETSNDSVLLLLDQLTGTPSSLDFEVDLQKGETTNDLPWELIIVILSCLPAKSLLRFKCVSKSWYNLINSPDFIKLHQSQSFSYGTLILHNWNSLYRLDFQGHHCHITKLYQPENFDLLQPHKLVGSCNGVLCFTCKSSDQLALYNPVTRAYKMLPLSGYPSQKLDPSVQFAFDCVSKDYKILRFTSDIFNSRIPERITLLYSLRANAWQIIENPPWAWDSVKSPSVVTASNNSLHWMDCDHKMIRGFNIFSQMYHEMSFPKKISPGYSPTLATLKGQLSIVTYYFDIWILKEYGVEESWTRLYRCPSMQWNSLYSSLSGLVDWRFGLMGTLACSEDGLKILVVFAGGRRHFICCDLESRETKKMEISGVPRGFSALLPWVESLAPLCD